MRASHRVVAFTVGCVLAVGAAPVAGAIELDLRDDIEGTPHDDVLRGTPRDDRLWGGSGFNRLFGLGADDRLVAGPRRDHVYGGRGDDVLQGRHGVDRLVPGRGRDRVSGGPAHDVVELRNDRNPDRVDCGRGFDVVRWVGHDRDKLDVFTGCERFVRRHR